MSKDKDDERDDLDIEGNLEESSSPSNGRIRREDDSMEIIQYEAEQGMISVEQYEDERNQKVLNLMIRGYKPGAIARKTGLSVSAIKKLIDNFRGDIATMLNEMDHNDVLAHVIGDLEVLLAEGWEHLEECKNLEGFKGLDVKGKALRVILEIIGARTELFQSTGRVDIVQNTAPTIHITTNISNKSVNEIEEILMRENVKNTELPNMNQKVSDVSEYGESTKIHVGDVKKRQEEEDDDDEDEVNRI